MVENCATDEEAYPLYYQMFIEEPEDDFDVRLRSLTGPQAEGSITIVGPWGPEDSSTNTFNVKVRE